MASLDRRGVIVACPSCGRSNRLGFATLDKSARCGKCRSDVPAPDVPIEVADSATFEAAMQASVPLVVDFWAPWCGPCRMVAPELQRVAREMRGEALVLKVNTDELTDVSARFRIQSIPTLAVLHRGREIRRAAGARAAPEIIAFVRQAVADDARRAS